MSPENIHNEVLLRCSAVSETSRAVASPEPEFMPVCWFYFSFIFCLLSCHYCSLNNSLFCSLFPLISAPDRFAASRSVWMKRHPEKFYTLNYSISCCDFLISHIMHLSRIYLFIFPLSAEEFFFSNRSQKSRHLLELIICSQYANMLMRSSFFK